MQSKFILSALLICSLFVVAGCSEGETEAKAAVPEKFVAIETLTVGPTHLKDILTLPGATAPDKDVLISSESAGTVIWLGVKEGDTVEKGDLLARLDASSSGARFDQAKAAKQLAVEQLRRRKQLLKKGVLAREEYDKIQAEMARTEASLKEMQVNLEYGIIRAPVSGIVNARYIDRGEYLNAGDKVVEIVDPTIIRTNINVPEMDIPYICKGQEVLVTVDARPDEKWKGVVDFVSFKASSTSNTFPVRILTDNTDGRIRAGMLARITLLRRDIPEAVTTPLYAVINQGGERIVYVNENGIAKARTIEIGIVEGDKVQVTKGLNIGDELIISGHTLVEDGMKVIAK
ncbi:MAG: efflux RND transporter periplasmic adaptor subunit [Desulfovibrio sp.]